MASRFLWCVIAILLGVRPVSAADPPATLNDVVVFAESTLVLMARSELASGQVVVNAPGGVVRVRRGFRGLQDTQVIADNIIVGAGTRSKPQFFDLFGNSVAAPHGYTINGTYVPSVPLPVFTFPDVPLVVTGSDRCPKPGRIAGDCVVRATDGPVTLQPGHYRQLKVRSHASVNFAGGEYNFESIRGGLRSTLVFNGTSIVNVADSALFSVKSVIGPVSPTELNGRCITFNIAGSRVRFQAYSDVNATVNAPAADVRMHGYSIYRGNFIGNSVRVGEAAVLEAAPHLVAACP